jgi:hypothetical protein
MSGRLAPRSRRRRFQVPARKKKSIDGMRDRQYDPLASVELRFSFGFLWRAAISSGGAAGFSQVYVS